MPELPEVETVKRGLEKLIIGKKVIDVEFDWPKSFPNDNGVVNSFLIGHEITGVRRRAKVLLIDLSSEYSLMIHLKMTGQLVFVAKTTKKALSTKQETLKNSKSERENLEFRALDLEFAESQELRFGAGHPNDSLVGNLPDRSTRVTITFSDGSHLFFNDQRKFGWMVLIPSSRVASHEFLRKLGPEPLDPGFTSKVFMERIRKRANTSIKAALLDQTVLAGVGNIYADESLWGVNIHPARKVTSITDSELKLLHSELIFVLNLSIEKGGSTDRNYVNAEGKKGSYIDFARVFRREGLPCPRCSTIIIKSRVAGRGTHTCPSCQKYRINKGS